MKAFCGGSPMSGRCSLFEGGTRMGAKRIFCDLSSDPRGRNALRGVVVTSLDSY